MFVILSTECFFFAFGINLCSCFIAVHLFGLTWQLQPVESELYENGVSKGSRGEESMDTTYSPLGGKISEKKGKLVYGLHNASTSLTNTIMYVHQNLAGSYISE